MYYNFVVQIPSEKGKILTKAKGGSSYVLFQYGTEYKPDKKYAIPKRTIIGKVCFLQALFPQKCRLNSSKLHGEFPQYCISSAGTLSGAGEEPLQAYKVY